MITWSHGGREVFVEGSWDNWKTKKLLQRTGKEFAIMKVLPLGYYQYKFIVDGEWKYAPDMPWFRDDTGNVYNFLDIKENTAGRVPGLVEMFELTHVKKNRSFISEDAKKLMDPESSGVRYTSASSNRSTDS